MSYQVLARKWRPRTFRELVGQQHVLRALVNALDHDRLHHAYLFTGTRGVGKTTIARILARCLNCETGVSSEPCGQCSACLEINEGRFVDLIEVDAASRTKVEDTRELLENVQYAPTRGRYKVYLIDEVHMLSSHSFNALLKTLEEPPPHVKFLLATTDPQKLPVTILSRCLQFHLKNMDPERIVGHLKHVLEQEMVPFDESALWQLGRAADGSMRDAMSLTDQAIAFGGGNVSENDVSAMLGSIDQRLVIDVVTAVASGDPKAVLDTVERLSQHAPDYVAALADIITLLHRVAIAQALPDALDNSRGDREQVLQLAQALAAEDVQLFYQTALMGRRDLPLSPEMRAGFEMVLLRMLAFRPQGVHSVPRESLPTSQTDDMGAGGPDPIKKPEASEVAAPRAAPSDVSPPAEPDQSVASIAPDLGPLASDPVDEQLASGNAPGLNQELMASLGLKSAREVPAPKSQPVETRGEPEYETVVETTDEPAEKPALAEPPAEKESQPEVVAEPVAEPVKQPVSEDFPLSALSPDNWVECYQKLQVGGVLQSTVSNCQLVSNHEGRCHFILDQQHSTLFDENHRERFAQLLTQHFGVAVEVSIDLGEVNRETPAAFAIRRKQERLDAALSALRSDPLVKAFETVFDATLDEESVKPI